MHTVNCEKNENYWKFVRDENNTSSENIQTSIKVVIDYLD